MGKGSYRKNLKNKVFKETVRAKEKSYAKTRNTQGVWILYNIVLILNFLIAEKQRTAAKRPGIERGTVEINWPRYFNKP